MVRLVKAGEIDVNARVPLRSELTTGVQEKIFALIKEQLGDEYVLLFPDSGTSLTFRLSGLTLRSTGTGFEGFLGVLGDEGACPRCYSGKGGRVYGLAFRKENTARWDPLPPATLSSAERQQIDVVLHEKLRGKRVVIEEIIGVHCKFPEARGAVVLFRDPDTWSMFLLALQRLGDTWAVMPVDPYTGESAQDGSILFEDSPRKAEDGPSYLRNSELFLLPDLDRSGSHKLLWVSDFASILYSIEPARSGQTATARTQPEYLLRMIRAISFEI
jgi:hypothetical protein